MDATTEAKNKPNDSVPKALYSQSDITALGSFSRSHLYNLVALGRFPAPALRLGPRFTRWSAAEVDAWFADPAAWIAAHAKAAA